MVIIKNVSNLLTYTLRKSLLMGSIWWNTDALLEQLSRSDTSLWRRLTHTHRAWKRSVWDRPEEWWQLGLSVDRRICVFIDMNKCLGRCEKLQSTLTFFVHSVFYIRLTNVTVWWILNAQCNKICFVTCLHYQPRKLLLLLE